jgi:hypothetical protein
VLAPLLRISIGDAVAIESPYRSPARMWCISRQSSHHCSMMRFNNGWPIGCGLGASRRRRLSYDFTVNNPRNSDVRGVSVPDTRALPCRPNACGADSGAAIARAVTRLHPAMYPVFNVPMALARTCWPD